MKLRTEKKTIYILLAFFTGVISLPWLQIAYNDPSTVLDWSIGNWVVVGGISLFYVIAQTLIAWQAYLSDPNIADRPKEPKI